MTAVITTGAAPYGDGSGFAVDIEIHENGDIWLKDGSTFIITPEQWEAVVKAVELARQAFAIIQGDPA